MWEYGTHLRGPAAGAARHLLARQPGAARGDPHRQPAPRRSGVARPRGAGAAPARPAGGRLARLRRPRQRVLLGRGGDGGRLRAGGGGWRGRADARRARRARRPALQPGRPRALRARLRAAARRGAEPAARRGRALGAVARRALQPLRARPEPRLGLGEPAGDAPPPRRLPLLGAAGLRRLPRDGERVDLLLPAGGRADPSAHRPPRPLLARRLRPRQRRGVRPPGVDLLQGGELRPLLSRLRRLLSQPARRGRHDLRDGGRRPRRAGAARCRTAACSPSPTAWRATSPPRSPPCAPRPTNRRRLVEDFVANREPRPGAEREDLSLVGRPARRPGRSPTCSPSTASRCGSSPPTRRSGAPAARRRRGGAPLRRRHLRGLDRPAARQPRRARSWSRSAPMSEPFLERQRQRLEQNLDAEFYDITAWSLPLAFNVETWVAPGPAPASRPLGEQAAGGLHGQGETGYLVPPQGLACYRAAAAMAADGVSFRVAMAPLSAGRARYPAGTLFMPRYRNGQDLAGRLERILAGVRRRRRAPRRLLRGRRHLARLERDAGGARAARRPGLRRGDGRDLLRLPLAPARPPGRARARPSRPRAPRSGRPRRLRRAGAARRRLRAARCRRTPARRSTPG